MVLLYVIKRSKFSYWIHLTINDPYLDFDHLNFMLNFLKYHSLVRCSGKMDLELILFDSVYVQIKVEDLSIRPILCQVLLSSSNSFLGLTFVFCFSI